MEDEEIEAYFFAVLNEDVAKVLSHYEDELMLASSKVTSFLDSVGATKYLGNDFEVAAIYFDFFPEGWKEYEDGYIPETYNEHYEEFISLQSPDISFVLGSIKYTPTKTCPTISIERFGPLYVIGVDVRSAYVNTIDKLIPLSRYEYEKLTVSDNGDTERANN